jgi:hypothetical protein
MEENLIPLGIIFVPLGTVFVPFFALSASVSIPWRFVSD